MSVRVKDLTKPQQRLWRLARAYAKAELEFAEIEYAYRSIGDSAGALTDAAEQRRERAASRLFTTIQNTLIVFPEE